MPPCLSLRDWYESGKSTHTDQRSVLPYLPTPVSPFHAEPAQGEGIEASVSSFDGRSGGVQARVLVEA